MIIVPVSSKPSFPEIYEQMSPGVYWSQQTEGKPSQYKLTIKILMNFKTKEEIKQHKITCL